MTTTTSSTTRPRPVPDVVDGEISQRSALALTALNETLRDDYAEDCRKGVDRWNRILGDVGAEVHLPHAGFHRAVGEFAGHRVSPDGRIVSEAEWAAREADWLPTADDKAYVISLMQGVTEPGRMAGWIAPPATGINQKPVDYEYVKA